MKSRLTYKPLFESTSTRAIVSNISKSPKEDYRGLFMRLLQDCLQQENMGAIDVTSKRSMFNKTWYFYALEFKHLKNIGMVVYTFTSRDFQD